MFSAYAAMFLIITFLMTLSCLALCLTVLVDVSNVFKVLRRVKAMIREEKE